MWIGDSLASVVSARFRGVLQADQVFEEQDSEVRPFLPTTPPTSERTAAALTQGRGYVDRLRPTIRAGSCLGRSSEADANAFDRLSARIVAQWRKALRGWRVGLASLGPSARAAAAGVG